MPLAHSSLSPEVSALSWKTVRYSPPSAFAAYDAEKFDQRMKANKQSIESLEPRIKALYESLCEPVPEGDITEKSRREVLEQ